MAFSLEESLFDLPADELPGFEYAVPSSMSSPPRQQLHDAGSAAPHEVQAADQQWCPVSAPLQSLPSGEALQPQHSLLSLADIPDPLQAPAPQPHALSLLELTGFLYAEPSASSSILQAQMLPFTGPSDAPAAAGAASVPNLSARACPAASGALAPTPAVPSSLGLGTGPSPMLAALQKVRQEAAGAAISGTVQPAAVSVPVEAAGGAAVALPPPNNSSEGTNRQSNSDSPTNTSGRGAAAALARGGTSTATRPRRAAAARRALPAETVTLSDEEDGEAQQEGGAEDHSGSDQLTSPRECDGPRRLTVVRARQKKSYDALIDPRLPADEIRRMRRMLSNRESARRSRSRRQTHLQQMEQQLQQLKMENETIKSELSLKQSAMASAEQEKAQLRAEVDALRRQVALQQPGSQPQQAGAAAPASAPAGAVAVKAEQVEATDAAIAAGLPPPGPSADGLGNSTAGCPEAAARRPGLKGTRPPSLHHLHEQDNNLQQLQKRVRDAGEPSELTNLLGLGA